MKERRKEPRYKIKCDVCDIKHNCKKSKKPSGIIGFILDLFKNKREE